MRTRITGRRGVVMGLVGGALVASAGVLGGLGVGSGLERSSATAAVEPTAYTVDPVHTNVLFKIRHAGVSNFYGRFNQIKGQIEYDADDFTESSLSFEIPISSVDTNSKTRDGHLRDAEFFNARQYPEASFESSSITNAGRGVYTLRGDLTMHGETREIEARVTDVRTGTFRDNPVVGFEARFTVQRSDFGIMKYLASDLSDDGPLGNTVEVVVAVEAVNE